MDPRTERTIASYNTAAEHYVARTESFSAYPGLEGELDDFLRRLPAGPLADTGTGSGRDALHLRDRGRQVIALDRSRSLLALLRRLAPDIPTLVADVRSLPFRPESLAGIVCSGVLLHIPRDGAQAETVLTEVRNSLRPGALAFISVKEGTESGWYQQHGIGPRWIEYYTADELIGVCTGVGLEIDELYGPRRRQWLTAFARRPLTGH